MKTKPNIWAKHVIEWVKKKLENKIWDISYKFELWDLSFKNRVLSYQQIKETIPTHVRFFFSFYFNNSIITISRGSGI